jgi:hypothetical protein
VVDALSKSCPFILSVCSDEGRPCLARGDEERNDARCRFTGESEVVDARSDDAVSRGAR